MFKKCRGVPLFSRAPVERDEFHRFHRIVSGGLG
jgi:hypothetical protein